MKALLLNPVKERAHSPGVLQIYLYLQNRGVDIDYADINLNPTHLQVLKSFLKRHPEDVLWLGIPADFLSRARVNRFVLTARRWGYTGHISIGGQFPTMYPENYLDMPIDSVILGQGEQVVEELLRRLVKRENWRSIPGLAFREGDRIHCNPNTFDHVPWNLIPENMDLLHFDYTKRDVHIPSSDIESCPNRCTWCPSSFVATAAGYSPRLKIAMKPVERIKKEILYGIRQMQVWYDEHLPDTEDRSVSIYLQDCDAFSTPELLNRNAVLARWISTEILPDTGDIAVHWFLWGTVRSLLPLSKNYLDTLVASKCTILVGIESFSDSQLRRLGKGTTRAQNLAVCRKIGLEGLGILMIFWDPWTTAQEMLDNWSGYMSVLHCPKPADMRQVDKHLELLPGTPLYRRYLPAARRHRQSKVGAIYWYDVLDPGANRLKHIMSQFVHYWCSLREAQQKLCEDKLYPLFTTFRAQGFNKCTFCEQGSHHATDERFKRTFMQILELAAQGERKWWRDAEELAREEILALKKDMEAHIFDGKTLLQLAMEYETR
jgi:hypothetical protein